MKHFLPLAIIEVFVWLILILSTLLISKIVFSINFGNATIMQRVATETARDGLSAATVLIWLFVWKKITDVYLWRTLGRNGASG